MWKFVGCGKEWTIEHDRDRTCIQYHERYLDLDELPEFRRWEAHGAAKPTSSPMVSTSRSARVVICAGGRQLAAPSYSRVVEHSWTLLTYDNMFNPQLLRFRPVSSSITSATKQAGHMTVGLCISDNLVGFHSIANPVPVNWDFQFWSIWAAHSFRISAVLAVAGLARCGVQRRATAVKKKGVRVVEGKDENWLSRF